MYVYMYGMCCMYVFQSDLCISTSALQPDAGQGQGDCAIRIVGSGHRVHFDPIGVSIGKPLVLIIAYIMYVSIVYAGMYV